jgi:hypothetical protein
MFGKYKPSVGSKAADTAEERAWMKKKSAPKAAVPTPKARPSAPAKKAAVSTGKPGESSMARTEAMRPTVKAVRNESRMAKAEASRPVQRQSTGPVSTGVMSKAPVDNRASFPKGKGTPQSSPDKKTSGSDAKGKRGIGQGRYLTYFGYTAGMKKP